LLGDGCPPEFIAKRTAANIAWRFGIPNKGNITAGFDADLWMVDLSQTKELAESDLLYRNPISAHVGQTIRGKTVRTLVRGRDPAPGGGRMMTRKVRGNFSTTR
jgi:dihydroorotase-like cyclic amidohydrolase